MSLGGSVGSAVPSCYLASCFLHVALGWHSLQVIQDSAICESLKGHMGGLRGCLLDSLEVWSVIQLVSKGE